MKNFKDVKAVIDTLRSIAARNDTEPEQRKKIEEALNLLRELRRAGPLDPPEVFEYVRRIVEKLMEAFTR